MGLGITCLLFVALADAGTGVVDAGAAGTSVDAGGAYLDAGATTNEGAEPSVLAVAPDAGPAHVPPVDVEPLPAFPARVNEQASPLAFRVAHGNKDARTRAREASDAMEAALLSAVADAPLVQIERASGTAVVRVRGRAVATLTDADAQADGARELGPWAAELETRLHAFVRAEELRHSAQGVALRLFVSVALALLALLTIRALRIALSRLETNLEDPEGTQPKPLKLFGVPLLSGEAVRGLLLVGLMVGRIFGYFAVVVVALLSVFSQFDKTRPWAGKIMSSALAPVVGGVDALVRALPGIGLAAVLVLAGAAALRLTRVLLDDIASGRVPSRLDGARALPARAAINAAIVLLIGPLVVGAAFLRFGTPIETLVLYAGGAVALASVPVLASAVVGGAVLWRSRVRLGDWVSIGRTEGEVAAIDLLDVTIVPAAGGTIVVPMIAFAFRPVARHPGVPQRQFVVHLRRTKPLAELEASLLQVVRAVDPEMGVEWCSVSSDVIEAVLHLSQVQAKARSELVRALAAASESGALPLAESRPAQA